MKGCAYSIVYPGLIAFLSKQSNFLSEHIHGLCALRTWVRSESTNNKRIVPHLAQVQIDRSHAPLAQFTVNMAHRIAIAAAPARDTLGSRKHGHMLRVI